MQTVLYYLNRGFGIENPDDLTFLAAVSLGILAAIAVLVYIISMFKKK